MLLFQLQRVTMFSALDYLRSSLCSRVAAPQSTCANRSSIKFAEAVILLLLVK